MKKYKYIKYIARARYPFSLDFLLFQYWGSSMSFNAYLSALVYTEDCFSQHLISIIRHEM